MLWGTNLHHESAHSLVIQSTVHEKKWKGQVGAQVAKATVERTQKSNGRTSVVH